MQERQNPGTLLKVPDVDDVYQCYAKAAKTSPTEFDLEELRELHKDMQLMILPSEVQSPPRNFGSKGHGKLKADAWYVLATVSAPATFLRLCVERSEEKLTLRKRQLVLHLMKLAVSLRLAASKRQTTETLELFRHCIATYVSEIPKAFNKEIQPNHHMALHVHEYFEEFGPAPEWWAFPYERMNGRMQKLHTNFRVGK